MDEKIIELRRLARETYDTCLRMAVRHMAEAEKPNAELSSDDDVIAAQGRREAHVRMAEVYARIAQAAQKVPGQQF